jgi:hypothetical protein
MKKLNKNIYIGVAITTFLISACNKQLDLKPYQSIDQSSAIVTAQDVQITLVGGYNRMGLSDLYGGGVFLYPDLLATQTIIDWQGTFQDLTDMTNQQITIDNPAVNSVWYDGYQVINQANNVLANLGKVASGDKDRTQGEAEFIRGLTYFDLARLFGRAWNDGDPTVNPAVPLVLTPTTSITAASYVPRATVSAIYAQAIADLTDAETKLPETNSFFANKYAAAAILARLYLQKQDYVNAAKEATTVITSGLYQLNANYSDEFPFPGQTHVDNTEEDIFAIQVTAQSGTNSLNTFYASADNSGRGDIIIKDSFVAGFETGDTRVSMYNDDSDGILRCDKFDNLYGNVHVIRLAELYLIRAEANLRLSSTTGDKPVNDVNVIRKRAGLKNLGSVTIANVLTERVHELAFEGGFFLHDAKRTNGAPSATVAGTLESFSPKLVFPIPQVELNANPKLVQNPTYGSN